MAKLEIPTKEFSVELAAGNASAAMKAASAEKSDVWNVPLENIRRLPDFNVRVNTPEYEQHKEEIAASILANGYYANKPLAGYVAKEGGENAIYLTDGYTRLAAVEIANERGAEITKIPVIIKPKSESLIELTIALVQDNEGRPLGPFEKAIVVQRLIGYGVEKADIARRLSMTERYVNDLEVLAAAPPKVRNLVLSGKVSATEAVKTLRKNPGKAGETLTKAVETATAQGKKKATGKHVKAAEGSASAPSAANDATVTEVREWDLKAGQKVAAETLTDIYYLNGGEWRRDPGDLDDAAEGEVIITEDLKVVLTITRTTAPAEATSEPAAGDDDWDKAAPQAEGGEEGSEKSEEPAKDDDEL
jgi:ParB family chromosome partitioning protein